MTDDIERGRPSAEGDVCLFEPAIAAPLSVEPNANAAISVRGLTKRFGDFVAVDGIDFDVARGEIFGFLGPNGAGKTTAIRMLTGTIAPNAGQALVLGDDVVTSPELVKRRIGYMSQKFALFEDMTVDENLRFYAGVYDLPAEMFARQRQYVLEMADLVGREDELTRNLSVGWKQRLALGAATIHEPELLFLDEPTSGVDPIARRHFWDLLYDLAARGVTLFVTTHYMDEASHCHRLAFIYRGRIIADGTPHQIRTECMPERIFEVSATDTEGVLEWLEDASDEGVREAYLSGAALHAVTRGESGLDATGLRSRLGEAGFSDVGVEPIEPSIEDVFVHLVSEQRQGDER
jgi:drug efflux transport system ATP-binding protein